MHFAVNNCLFLIHFCDFNYSQFHANQNLTHSPERNGAAYDFECADHIRKVRMVLSELFLIQSQVFQRNHHAVVRGVGENVVEPSELFGSEIYLAEIIDIICIALAKLPSQLNLQEVIETLLYVNSGTRIICCIVANMPNCFKKVVTELILNGDEEKADERPRLNALNALCDMNPEQMLHIRTFCVETTKMPTLMLRLSLKEPTDMVRMIDMRHCLDCEFRKYLIVNFFQIAFVTDLLMINDQTRSWFVSFVRAGRKRKNVALKCVRDELLKQLRNFLNSSVDAQLPDDYLIQGNAILRLYCALNGIAGVE